LLPERAARATMKFGYGYKCGLELEQKNTMHQCPADFIMEN